MTSVSKDKIMQVLQQFRSPVTLLCFLILMAIGCNRADSPGKTSFTGEAQGTYYTVTYYSSDGKNYQPSIDSLLASFDQTASLWVPNSLINRVNRNEDVVVDSHFMELFRLSQEVSELTNGYFDITVGPLVNAWGFGADNLPAIEEGTVDTLLPLVNFRNIGIRNGRVIKADDRMKVDFNAIAQGYSVDLVADFLESKGIRDYLVDIGGEVYAHGAKPGNEAWRVGIEKPSDDQTSERKIMAEVPVASRAVATSGNYRKYYQKEGIRYAHTIDPKTGSPVQHTLLSVTVLADRCARADAFATAFMVMGLESALRLIEEHQSGLDAYFIFSDINGGYNTLMTEGLKESLVEVR